MKGTAHTDGGNRAHYACAATVILREDGEVFERSNLFMGVWTNNVMEYAGVLLALKTAREAEITQLSIYTDSELICNHLNGIYQMKNKGLKPIFEDCLKIASEFDFVSISHVPREQNIYADAICNVEMDRVMGRKTLVHYENRLKKARLNPPSGITPIDYDEVIPAISPLPQG